MARIIYCHPSQTKYDYHIYTDLDFWDARRVLKSMAIVKRNFAEHPHGDEFPTQVVGTRLGRSVIREIEKRLRHAIVSPPRHVVVRSMVFDGFFEFDPRKYYPVHWSRGQMIHFTYHRLPLQQSALCSPYQTVELHWMEETIRLERVRREQKFDPVIHTLKESRKRLIVPSCF